MRSAFLSLCLVLVLSITAVAGELGGVTMPDTMDDASGQLVLNGMGQRSVVWIDVYVAGLYLSEKTQDSAKALAMGGSKRMVMAFQRDVDGEDICGAWTEGMDANAPGGSAAHVDQLAKICADTPEETKDGQTVIYAYSADTDAVTYEIDGQIMGTYQGADFFNALLACWIGPEPGPGDEFKEGVLGLE